MLRALHAAPCKDRFRECCPPKPKKASVRPREYLTEDEVHQLMRAAGRVGRHVYRDASLILMAYRHGLRVSEVIALGWSAISLADGRIPVQRLTGGVASVHPLRGPEIRAWRKLRRDDDTSPCVFVSQRGGPLTEATVRKIVSTRAGEPSPISCPMHPPVLRHASGYKLANDRHDTRAIRHYLGHKNIQHSVRYTQLSCVRFQNLWID